MVICAYKREYFLSAAVMKGFVDLFQCGQEAVDFLTRIQLITETPIPKSSEWYHDPLAPRWYQLEMTLMDIIYPNQTVLVLARLRMGLSKLTHG